MRQSTVRARAFGAALAATATLAQADPAYRLVDLGAGYTAYQVDQQGLVAGSENNVQPVVHKGQQWHDILYDDSNGAYAIGVDGWGDTVADYTDTDTSHYVMIAYPNGDSSTVAAPFPTNVNYATGISPGGTVIGFAYDHAVPKCYVWNGGNPKLIKTPGDNCVANGINAKDQVTGGTNTVAGGHAQAFVWNKGVLHLLGAFGGTDAWGVGITAQGHVAVKVQTAASTLAGLYADGAFVDLGMPAGGLGAWPTSINRHDQVVGSWYDLDADGHAVYRTFLWSDGRMLDLPSLVDLPAGWSLTDPNNGGGPQSINDKGVIVGNGMLDGVYHGYMLVPTRR